jgi:hypothetical protein
MAERHERDSESERLQRSGPNYGPRFGDQPPLANGNYTKIVIAWAAFATLILTSTFAYLWSVKDSGDKRRDDELMMLWNQEAQDRETIGRVEAHVEYLQRQVDKIQK